MIGGRRVIGVVPARAGSQRLPGKNVRPLAGKPMIRWTLDAALASTVLDRVVVTSDDEAALAIARDAGVEAIRRPEALAGPEASVIDAIRHALGVAGGHWDYVVLLQPTSPLRTAADIDEAVALCHDRAARAVISVSPLAKPPSFHARINADGRLTEGPNLDATVVINGAVYVGRPECLFLDGTFRHSEALAIVTPSERGWDVDTWADFFACEAYLRLANRGNL